LDKEYGLSKYKREMVKEHLSVIRQKGAKAGVELCHQGIYGHEADGIRFFKIRERTCSGLNKSSYFIIKNPPLRNIFV